ncbi:MAG TPA: glycosyltransferase family 39 protein [Geobacteraceae bacterium]|nr:glycosyltransferase family 39 protein [Geobacteraceae bacterium]
MKKRSLSSLLTDSKETCGNTCVIFYIIALFVSVYLLTASGMQNSDVGGLRLEVVASILERHDLNVPAGMGMTGADGREYSWFGIGSVLLSLPLYLLGKIFGVQPCNPVMLLNPLFSVATVSLVFLFTLSLGYSRRSSVLVSILYGFGTLALYYAKDPGDHALETFFILLSFFGMHRFLVSGRTGYILISGMSLGMAFLTRGNSILIVPPLLLMLVASRLKRNDALKASGLIAGGIVPFCCAMIPFVSMFFWYNNYRFGSPFESGYALMARRLGIDFFGGTPLADGLAGLIASPGKGFLYYSPVTILFFFSIRSFWKNHPAIAAGFSCTMMVFIFFYAKNIYWHGDWAWGPRYLLALTPFFVIPIAELLDGRNRMKRRWGSAVVYSLLACGIVVQLLGMSISMRGYFRYLHSVRKVPFTVVEGVGVRPIVEPSPETYFDWRLSPILGHAEMLYSILSRRANDRYEPAGMRGADVLDYWWTRRYYAEKSTVGLFPVPLLIVCGIVAAIRLYLISGLSNGGEDGTLE